MSDKEGAVVLKVEGNKAFASHDWLAAIDFKMAVQGIHLFGTPPPSPLGPPVQSYRGVFQPMSLVAPLSRSINLYQSNLYTKAVTMVALAILLLAYI